MRRCRRKFSHYGDLATGTSAPSFRPISNRSYAPPYQKLQDMFVVLLNIIFLHYYKQTV